MENENDNLIQFPKVFEIQITAANQKFSETFELDKSVKKVYGVSFSSEKPDLLYHRGYARIEINKREFSPENFTAQKLMFGINAVKPYKELNKVIIGNGLMKIDFTDKADGRTVFAAYTVYITLECEIETD